MKPVLFLIMTGQCLLAASSNAADIPLNAMGEQFYSKTLEVEWKLTTNPFPATIPTFKVVPVKFAKAMITNLVSWGGFAASNRVRSSVDGERIPRHVVVYRTDDDRRGLTFDPSRGAVFLNTPIWSTEMPDGVPDKPRAYALATNILWQLGISTNEIIFEDGKPRAWFYEGMMTRWPREQPRKPITRRSHMGVEFRRQLGGIQCDGEFIHIDFESHEQITQLEINWCGVQSSSLYPVASTGQMTAWIKEGRARVQSFGGPNDARWAHATDIKRITVIGITPHYSGATSFSATGGDEEIGRLYPYAMLQADAEFAPDDHEIIWLFCPVISKGLNSPSQSATNDIGFSIYPTHPREKQLKQGEIE